MITLKYIVLLLFSLQLSTCVFCTSNVTEEANVALKLLNNQIESSSKLVSETIPNVWNQYISTITETIVQGLSYDVENYTALENNLTEFANIVTDGKDCVTSLLNVYKNVKDFDVNLVTNEKLVYDNFLAVANLEIDYVLSHFKDLEMEFNVSCVTNWNNCIGTSKFVIAEVQRLMLIARRIPYDFLSETHLLGYRLQADWAITQAIFNTEFQKIIEVDTTCLALKFEDLKTGLLGHQFEKPKDDETILDKYMDLFFLAKDTFTTSVTSLLSYSLNVTKLGETQKDFIIGEIQNAIFKANQTVNSLINFAQDLNITVNCTIPQLNAVQSSSVISSLSKYSQYLVASTLKHGECFDYLNITFSEISTIDFQVNECYGTVDCGSISKKLDEKMTEIPSLLQGRGNATAVLQHQFITAIRKSGYKIVRNVLDQLEAPIVLLKDCIRSSFYNED